MSRSGYDSDDCDTWALIRWRGAVTSAIRGARGQAFIKEAIAALDALPVRELVREDLQHQKSGEVCTLGAVGLQRGLDMSGLDAYDYESVVPKFGIASALGQEIMWENDEGVYRPERETKRQRWERMRNWLVSRIPHHYCGA